MDKMTDRTKAIPPDLPSQGHKNIQKGCSIVVDDTYISFINSSQNEGLPPSCIALSFDGFGSISWCTI
jgi:hypothetical protein